MVQYESTKRGQSRGHRRSYGAAARHTAAVAFVLLRSCVPCRWGSLACALSRTTTAYEAKCGRLVGAEAMVSRIHGPLFVTIQLSYGHPYVRG